MLSLRLQLIYLFVLAIPIATIAWTVTHEEVFREPREYCLNRSQNGPSWYQRKFFYLFTCEYCFSHYIAAGFLLLTRYKLLFADWRGYVVALFALVWISNQYMSLYNRLRLDIKVNDLKARSRKRSRLQQSSGVRDDRSIQGVKPSDTQFFSLFRGPSVESQSNRIHELARIIRPVNDF